MQAEKLHRDVALLSNELHRYNDNDIDEVKPIIEKIIKKRQDWTKIQFSIKYHKKFGKFPDEETKREPTEDELRMKDELPKMRVLICQNEKKLRDNPTHKNAIVWESELVRLQGLKKAYEAQLLRAKHQVYNETEQ